ncbi:hypothetical protein ABTF60_18870, partial [Acinetobacter baumannii]
KGSESLRCNLEELARSYSFFSQKARCSVALLPSPVQTDRLAGYTTAMKISPVALVCLALTLSLSPSRAQSFGSPTKGIGRSIVAAEVIAKDAA